MINNWTGVGRLTKDSELRFLPDGKGVANFTIAINRNFKNKDGEYEADFINVVTFRNAETVANVLKKGSLAGVVGRIQSRSYDNSKGDRVFVTECNAELVQFLEPKGSSKPQQNNQQQNKGDGTSDPFKDQGESYDPDSLPF